jgi:exonuclease VII large subunit
VPVDGEEIEEGPLMLSATSWISRTGRISALHRLYLDDSPSASPQHRLYMKNARTRFDALSQRMHDLNPRAILARGYSITSRADSDTVITDSSAVSPGDALSITLHKGGLDVSVVDKKT